MPSAPEPPLAYRVIRGALRLVLLVFFRRIEVTGVEHVPASGGGILVSWHPNGLVDPALILGRCPRQVVFGARHGLFAWPGLGWLLRRVGTVPIYRAVDAAADEAARREANARSLDALASRVAQGSFSSLFPEGESHDAPHPVELKTGAARLFFRALELQPPGAPPPVIVPVGLHYDAKDVFRSSALVAFHPPLELPPALVARPPSPDQPADEPAEAARERGRALTAEVERVLHEVVLATEDWPLHRMLHRGRSLMRAERAARAGRAPGPADMLELSLGFARARQAYLERRRTDPERVAELRRRVEWYDEDLRSLGLEDPELDRAPRLLSRWLGAIILLQFLLVFLLLPPILVVGVVVNLPAAALLWAIARLAARKRKDEATVKILVGALLFPLTWLAAGVLAALGHQALHARFPSVPDQPLLAGLLVATLAAAGGAVAVRYRRVSRETLRALRVRLTRRSRDVAVERLRRERAVLHDAIDELAQGLALPGVIASDGRVKPEPSPPSPSG
ncbi:MAG: 1-acyl-sn-glycerol-3-phosphate acyltransferase [Planctomycetes bacterium]|nr:1-acyl-sn-glycerol-3-phosphate acyltransferase [Planctomycetota bacterium]